MYLQFSALKDRATVEAPQNTVVPGVQMIRIGPARGHKAFKNADGEFECYEPSVHAAIPSEALYQVTIDQDFVDSVLDLAQQAPNGIKALMNHNDDVRDIFGACRNWRQDGDTVRADVHLFPESPHCPYIQKIASEIPEEVGFSINFEFNFVEKAGCGENTPKNVFCVCTKLSSSDLVTEGATTSGLFHSKTSSHKPTTIMSKKLAEGEAPENEQQQEEAPDIAAVITDAVTAAVAPVLNQVTDLSARMKKLEDGPEKKDDELENDDKDGDGDTEEDTDKDGMSETDKMAAKVAKKVLSSIGLLTGAVRPSVSGAVDTSKMNFSQIVDHIAKTENKSPVEANKLALQRYPEKHREFRASLSKKKG
jgi:hypothetical protein